MSTKVSTLSECFVAKTTCKWSLTCVFSEVITKIAGLLKHRVARWVHAFKVQFYSLSLWVSHFNGLVPLRWDPLEGL